MEFGIVRLIGIFIVGKFFRLILNLSFDKMFNLSVFVFVLFENS
jgi:hypothetical protein